MRFPFQGQVLCTYGSCSKIVTVPVDLLQAVVNVVDPIPSVCKTLLAPGSEPVFNVPVGALREVARGPLINSVPVHGKGQAEYGTVISPTLRHHTLAQCRFTRELCRRGRPGNRRR